MPILLNTNRGPVAVILINHGKEDFKVSPGDHIAQLICEKIAYTQLKEEEELDSTEREASGFGSTAVQ